MTNDVWSFRGHIAVQLELYAKTRVTGIPDDEMKSIYSADSIEGGTFVDALQGLLLRSETGKPYYEFLKKADPYRGKGASKIPIGVAKELYQDFIELVN